MYIGAAYRQACGTLNSGSLKIYLITALFMARPNADRLINVVWSTRRIDTYVMEQTGNLKQ